MEKKIYDLVLQPGTDEAAFLANEAAGMEVKSNLNLFDGLLCMLLTEEEAKTLESSSKVVSIFEAPKVVPTAYPASTLTTPGTMITRDNPTGNGADYIGTQFWFTGEQGGSAINEPVGFFTTTGEDASHPGASVQQRFAGQYVDIVAIEAGTPVSLLNNYYSEHPDLDVTVATAETLGLTFTHDLTTTSTTTDYLVSGTTKNILRGDTTLTNETDRPLYVRPGETLNITNNSTTDPIEIVESSGFSYAQVSGVTNQGASNGATLSWTPTLSDVGKIIYYRTQRAGAESILRGPITVQTHGSRFVKTDWSTYDSGASDTSNNQATNNVNFTTHAVGVLSAAAGNIGGWAKVSEMRVIYLADGIPTAYNAVLAWHNSKPVNPETGVRNATVTTGAWGIPSYEHEFLIPIDNVSQISAYDVDGNLSNIARPGSGWGNDLTPFVNNLMVPRVVQDPADSVRKWMISIPNSLRYTTFDTIMNSYDSAGGIYHFKSAGNSSHVAVKPTDPRWNNSIIFSGNYVDVNLIDANSDGSSEEFGFTSISGSGTRYPLRTFLDGATNCFTVAATQHSTQNPLLDDYSSRGPMIDIAGHGSYTWTSYFSQSLSDGYWGYFSGTSCAAPVVAGAAAVMISNFFVQRGVYPTTAQLKELIDKHSKEVLVGESTVDWSNAPSPTDFSQSRLYSSTDVYSIKQNDFINGGSDLSDLHGTPPKRVFLPWGIAMGTGQYIGTPNGRDFGKRPTTGQAWPRRKIKVEA